MAKKVLWVSRHIILPVQKEWLEREFGLGTEIVPYKNPFDPASQIAKEFRDGAYDEMAIVGPDAVIERFIKDEGIQPYRSIMKNKRFIGFRKVVDYVGFIYEDDEEPEESEGTEET